MTMHSHDKPTIVVGEGWAALGTVGMLASQGHPVVWITGTGARIAAPLPVGDAAETNAMGMTVWAELAGRLGIECGPVETGSYIREFRNKAFRETPWSKAPTPEHQNEVRAESLWAPETRIAPVFEARATLTLGEIEEAIRARLADGTFKNLRRVDGTPVIEVRTEGDRLVSVLLGDGEEIECDRFVFADRWSAFAAIQGIPEQLRKKVAAHRKHEPVGVLQAIFTHHDPIGAGLSEGFYSVLNKEPGEEQERRLWGYFSSDGKKSFWTVCLSSEEVEDNHQIAKKLRRMKSALEKMFCGAPWLSPERTSFASNISDEQVRLAEGLLLSTGDPSTFETELKVLTDKQKWAAVLTDGFGPSAALQQVAVLLGTTGSDAQTENVDLVETAAL